MALQVPGFQDYARRSEQGGITIDTLSGVIHSNPTSPVEDSLGYGYINLTLIGPFVTALFTVTVDFYTDPAGANRVAQRFYSPIMSNGFAIQVPVVSRYFDVAITWVSGSITDTISATMFGANAEAPYIGRFNHAAPFLIHSQALAASTSFSQEAVFMYEGPATWSIATSAGAAWHGILEYLDLGSGLWTQFSYIDGGLYGLGTIQSVTLPPAPVRCTATNADTVGRTLSVSVLV